MAAPSQPTRAAVELPPPTARVRPELTLGHLLDLLERAAWLRVEDRRAVEVREPKDRARLLREREGARGAPRPSGPVRARAVVTPVEVLASMRLTRADRPGAVIEEDDLARLVAEDAGLPYRKLDPLRLDAKLITETLSRPFARRHVVVPIAREGDVLTVAVADPFDVELVESIYRLTGCAVQQVVTAKTDILRVITDMYGFRRSVDAAEREARGGPTSQAAEGLSNLEQYVRLKSVEEIEATDQHVVAAVEYVIHYALDQRASDIHVEPKREHSQIRFRIDGVLNDVYTLPKVVHAAFVSRVKILARLDISERRRPQDGRIKTDRGGRLTLNPSPGATLGASPTAGAAAGEVELRISTLPTVFGEKLVVRVFDPEVQIQDLSELGFFPGELRQFEGFVARPHGLILVTGPTGSGKTTTLYSALRSVASTDVNVTTIEDPIEMVVEQFNQVAVQPKIDLTFASALRTMLRQDPDVIMVGEIRDSETAEMAVQAALTGHLVFSTLHTNDTATSVTRLLELGVPPFLIGSTLIGVLAQRLVRSVCKRCAVETVLTPDQIDALGIRIPEGAERRLPVMVGEGCVACRGTGLFGRTGVFEVLEVTPKIRKLIGERRDAREIGKEARADGMITLRECAIKKLALGLTSYDEVVRATTNAP